MHKWNKVDPYNLEYIEKQVEVIKNQHHTLNDKEAEKVDKRKVEDILEEQLIVLQQMQHTLEKIEVAASQKSWKKFF